MRPQYHRGGTMNTERNFSAFWSGQGLHPCLELAFYCVTGWRASLTFYFNWLMGWQRNSVYDGGWFEWSDG